MSSASVIACGAGSSPVAEDLEAPEVAGVDLLELVELAREPGDAERGARRDRAVGDGVEEGPGRLADHDPGGLVLHVRERPHRARHDALDLDERAVRERPRRGDVHDVDLRQEERCAVGKDGEEAERFAVLVRRRVEEAGGEDAQRPALEPAEVGEERGDDCLAVGRRHVEHVRLRPDAEVAGDVTVGGVVHEHGAGRADVHGRRVGGAVDGVDGHLEVVDVGLEGVGVDEERGADGAAVRVGREGAGVGDANGDELVRLAGSDGHLLLDDHDAGVLAVGNGNGVGGRGEVEERGGRAEGDVVEGDLHAVAVGDGDVHERGGGVGGVVDELDAGGRVAVPVLDGEDERGGRAELGLAARDDEVEERRLGPLYEPVLDERDLDAELLVVRGAGEGDRGGRRAGEVGGVGGAGGGVEHHGDGDGAAVGLVVRVVDLDGERDRLALGRARARGGERDGRGGARQSGDRRQRDVIHADLVPPPSAADVVRAEADVDEPAGVDGEVGDRHGARDRLPDGLGVGVGGRGVVEVRERGEVGAVGGVGRVPGGGAGLVVVDLEVVGEGEGRDRLAGVVPVAERERAGREVGAGRLHEEPLLGAVVVGVDAAGSHAAGGGAAGEVPRDGRIAEVDVAVAHAGEGEGVGVELAGLGRGREPRALEPLEVHDDGDARVGDGELGLGRRDGQEERETERAAGEDRKGDMAVWGV
jgi:hypothetical protein